jgi:hypothetical protein
LGVTGKQVHVRSCSGRGVEHLVIQQADTRPALTEHGVVVMVPRRRQVDEELRRSEPSGDVEPLPGFEPGTYGLRNRIPAAHPCECSRTFDDLPTGDEDPHASSQSLVHRPDRVALELLHAQAAWISTHDAVTLRRALLRVLTSLDE